MNKTPISVNLSIAQILMRDTPLLTEELKLSHGQLKALTAKKKVSMLNLLSKTHENDWKNNIFNYLSTYNLR